MKLLLDKSPIDIEQYTEDISSEWVDFFEEIHEHGKEKQFNKFAEMCFEGNPVTIDEFNKWLEEEEDLIRDSIGLSNEDDEDYEEELYEEDEDEEF
jgi:hypothetical protein